MICLDIAWLAVACENGLTRTIVLTRDQFAQTRPVHGKGWVVGTCRSRKVVRNRVVGRTVQT
jgi:hypothetical protein